MGLPPAASRAVWKQYNNIPCIPVAVEFVLMVLVI